MKLENKPITEERTSTMQKSFCLTHDLWSLWKVRIKLNQTWKKAFRSELLEICRTKNDKSSLDIFNFSVVLAGHDKVCDAGRTTKCRPIFKAPSLQTKLQNMKDLSRTWVLTGNRFEDFRQKNYRKFKLDHSKHPSKTQGQKSEQLIMALVKSKR